MSSVEEGFSAYFDCWIKQLEGHLQQLVMRNQIDYERICAALTAHHKEYYSVKWVAIEEDVLAFFSPPWLSPLESAFHWITGWRPSTVFRLVESLKRSRAPLTSLTQLTEEQSQSIQTLKTKIRSEEEKVDREMERQQVVFGDQKMVELARLVNRLKERQQDESMVRKVDTVVEGAVKDVRTGLLRVVKMADYVRLKTLKGLLEILTPKQGVDFLAVFATVQIQMKKWGQKKVANESEMVIPPTIIP